MTQFLKKIICLGLLLCFSSSQAGWRDSIAGFVNRHKIATGVAVACLAGGVFYLSCNKNSQKQQKSVAETVLLVQAPKPAVQEPLKPNGKNGSKEKIVLGKPSDSNAYRWAKLEASLWRAKGTPEAPIVKKPQKKRNLDRAPRVFSFDEYHQMLSEENELGC